MMRPARLSQSRDDAMRNQRADGSGGGGGGVAGIDRSCAMHNVGRKDVEEESAATGGRDGSARRRTRICWARPVLGGWG